jgi:hypothetical protein
MHGAVDFIAVDCDEVKNKQTICSEYGIQYFPTVKILIRTQDGKLRTKGKARSC